VIRPTISAEGATPTTPGVTTAPPPPATTTAPATAAKVTYAGSTVGGQASIAIAVADGHAVAYLCDGQRAEAWLQGTANDGKLNLAGTGGASLTGTEKEKCLREQGSTSGSSSSGSTSSPSSSGSSASPSTSSPSGAGSTSGSTGMGSGSSTGSTGSSSK